MKVWQLIAELQQFPAGRDVAICGGNNTEIKGVYETSGVECSGTTSDMDENLYIVSGNKQCD